MIDRLDPRTVSSVSMFSQAAALLANDPDHGPTLSLACCAAYGFSVGNIITLPSLIMQREFPPASFWVWRRGFRPRSAPSRARSVRG